MNARIRQEEFYFGPRGTELFGVLHLPTNGEARGAVVMCNSLAKEQMDACRGLRLLADRLASAGHVVLRFDYAGTGDSHGEQVRNDSVAQWRAGIVHAVDQMAELGFDTVTAIGLRMGALLLDSVLAEEPRIDRVVYWDPIGRGRAFVREQQALYKLSVGADETTVGDDVPLVGTTLSATAAKEIGTLELCGAGEHVAARLLAVRPDTTDKRVVALRDRLDVESMTVEGMREFVSPESFLVALPETAIADIAEWVCRHCDVTTRVVTPGALRRVATMSVPAADSGSATEVIERIEYVGDRQLFAIRTLPIARTAGSEPRTVVFFATANDPHVGPNREWVDLARKVAAAGGEAIRFDRSGVGESGPVALETTAIYSADAIAEAITVVRHANADPRRVLVTGVCSGSWYSAYVARELGTGAAVLINSIAWSWRRKRSAQGQVRPEDLGVPRSDPEWQKTPRARIKNGLRQRLPYPLWRELGRYGITQIPEVLVRPLIEAGVETTLVLSPHDFDWYRDQRGPEGLARIDASKGVPTLVAVGSGDHSAFHESVRSSVRAPILKWVSNR